MNMKNENDDKITQTLKKKNYEKKNKNIDIIFVNVMKYAVMT